MNWRLGRTTICAFVLSFLLTGCGTAGASPTPSLVPVPESDPGANPTPIGIQGDDQLVVYSGRSESLVGPLLAEFEAETGIRVQVRWGQTAELAATILEEGANSPADIFYAQDPGGLGALTSVLAELPDDLLSLVDPRFLDPQGHWVGISGRARAIVYNTDAVAEADLPLELEAFTSPVWRGRLGWAPTNASFQTMVTAMRVVWGEEKTRQWLLGILANDPISYDNNTAIVAGVGAGEVDIGFVNHYYLYRFLKEEGEGFPARNYFLPGGGPGSLVMVSGAGVLATSRNQAAGQTLIRYLLSNEAQTYFTEQTFEYPLISEVPIAPGLTPLSELHPLQVDMADLADLPGTVALLQDTGVLP